VTPPPATPPKIPDYELLKPIGRGSYGEVWLARSVTGVFRIIKVVRRDRFDDERPYRRELEGISRFQAAVSGRPRQLALLHVGRNDEAGYFYYVMEPADDAETGSAIDPERYIPLTLGELFKRRGRLPAAECVQLALELARGLAVLHAENLIHRDIKPSNIIFVQRVPKLADVGLVATSDTAMTCVGTLGYSPPEGPGSVSADLYGLGKVLYEIATGLDRLEYPRLPADIADTSDAPLLREINALVLRTCDRDPDQRPASAEAFARDLELIQAGQSVAFYEALRRRLRFFAAAAALIAVLTAVGATLTLWRSSLLFATKERNRNAFYKSDLAVAQLALAGGDLGRARAALLRQIPEPGDSDLRNLEWYILAHAVRGDGKPLETAATGVAVRNLVADRSGRWLAAGFANDTAAIWDLHTGRVARRLTDVRVVGGFTTDGLLVVDEPARALRFESPTHGTVRRIETGRRLMKLAGDSAVWVVFPTADFRLGLLDLSTTSIRTEFNASAHWPDYSVARLDFLTSRNLLTLGLFREQGAQRSRLLAVANLRTNTVSWQTHVPGRFLWVRASPDARSFAVNEGSTRATVRRYDDPNYLVVLKGHQARIEDAAFSSDGALLATASADQTIRVWDVGNGSEVALYLGLDRPATSVTWLSDGRTVVAGDSIGNLRAFPFPNHGRVELLSGFFADVHGDFIFDPSGDRIAISATTNSIRILPTNHSLPESQEAHNGWQVLKDVFQPVRFDANHGTLTAFGADWSLRTVRLSDGVLLDRTKVTPDGISVKSFALAPSGSHVALSAPSGRIILINTDSRSSIELRDPEGTNVWAMAFSFDAKELWTGSARGSIASYSTEDGSRMDDGLHIAGDINSIAVSRDTRWIAVSVFNDSSIRVFDRSSGKWIRTLTSHRRVAQSMTFSSDSTRLISGGLDGRLILWRLPEFDEIAAFDAAPLHTPTGDEGISTIRLSPAASALAAFTEYGSLRLWKLR
jgi:WD40 repeat protein